MAVNLNGVFNATHAFLGQLRATKGRIVRALLEDGAAPGTPARFADHLGALGWKVEQVDNRLDVVVSDL